VVECLLASVSPEFNLQHHLPKSNNVSLFFNSENVFKNKFTNISRILCSRLTCRKFHFAKCPKEEFL
jgi:hypothetical protein